MRVKVLRNKILSIVVSLILSFFLWLALAGQDTSITDLAVPLELANLPGDLVIKTAVPTSVSFQVLTNTAQGRFLADRKLHVWLNVASAREGLNSFPVAPDSLELPRGVSVRKVSPQVIEFEAVKTTDKVVPLKATVVGRPNPAYLVRSMILEPDEVTLKAPQELLETIDSIPTSDIVIDGLTEDTVFTVSPVSEIPSPALEITPREIKVIFNVEERRLEETFAGLPIEIDLKSGLTDDPYLEISPTEAEISVSWPASRSRSVRAEDLKVRVFVDDDKLRLEGILTPPVVAVAPSGVTVTAIKPVNVTVTRKNTAGAGSNTAPTSPPPAQPSATD